MGRPREHDDSTAEALLDAAEKLLAEGGEDAVSVRAVADAVGTTTRAVYTLFQSKGGLIEQLAARGYLLLARHVTDLRVTDDPAADLVAAGLLAFRRFALERPHLFRLTFDHVPALIVDAPTVQTASRTAYEALAIRVRRWQAAVRDTRSAEEMAFVFHSLCVGLAIGELSREPPPIGANMWRRVLPAFDGPRLWRRALEGLVGGLPRAR